MPQGCTRTGARLHANSRIGVGIVGASADRGGGRLAHVPALLAANAFQIRAVSTTRMESANATASRLGADLAFDTHQALVLRPEVDLVVVAVKVPEHEQIVSDALTAGKMVFCEWPLARNLSEAEALEGVCPRTAGAHAYRFAGRPAPADPLPSRPHPAGRDRHAAQHEHPSLPDRRDVGRPI
ncbi:Gfo/Idh/MocA family oxidoreductase [Mycolicibacterium cosmeticum]|uniref:Gfo/Idh/MocA family oxidoreductase n=1 Tax=Mycolicibacterium cosmeticum TaxID=258533 RepID=UPI003204F0DB